MGKWRQAWPLPDSCLSAKWALISGKSPRKVASGWEGCFPFLGSCIRDWELGGGKRPFLNLKSTI